MSRMSDRNLSLTGLLLIFSDIHTVWETEHNCAAFCWVFWNVLTYSSPSIGSFDILATCILWKSSKIIHIGWKTESVDVEWEENKLHVLCSDRRISHADSNGVIYSFVFVLPWVFHNSPSQIFLMQPLKRLSWTDTTLIRIKECKQT